MAIPTVFDEVPTTLIRIFDNRLHADAFMERGLLRMRMLRYYKDLEGTRGDATEGESFVLVPGNVPEVSVSLVTGEFSALPDRPGHFKRRSEFMNPTFVSCFSLAGVSEQVCAKFGRWSVQVTNPPEFLNRLGFALGNLEIPGREIMYAESFPIRYDKGAVIPMAEIVQERVRLDYGQKPREFQDEKEYRIVFVTSGGRANSPDYVDIEMGSLSDIAAMSQDC